LATGGKQEVSYEIIPISALMTNKGEAGLLELRLKEFVCLRDRQLEDFIHNKAIGYEAKGFSRTYLVADTSVEPSSGFRPIAAFFTLAITATDYDNISRSRKEKVLGSKPGRNTFKAFPGLLIAQLARDDRYGSDFINGEALLLECEHYIELGRQYVGGRNIYLDCKEPLVTTYQKSGYRLLSDASTEEGYYKMYKVLPDTAQ
jgi:hypothetical protein